MKNLKPELVIGKSTVRDESGNDITRALILSGHDPERVPPITKVDRQLHRMKVIATLKRAVAAGQEWAKKAMFSGGYAVRYLSQRAAGQTDFKQPSLASDAEGYVVDKPKPKRNDNAPWFVHPDDPNRPVGKETASYLEKVRKSLQQKQCRMCSKPFTSADGKRTLCDAHAGKAGYAK